MLPVFCTLNILDIFTHLLQKTRLLHRIHYYSMCSNFVGFPIYLNGKELNTVQAVWALPKNEVTESQHTDFYRFVSNSYDTPSFRMHFQVCICTCICTSIRSVTSTYAPFFLSVNPLLLTPQVTDAYACRHIFKQACACTYTYLLSTYID